MFTGKFHRLHLAAIWFSLAATPLAFAQPASPAPASPSAPVPASPAPASAAQKKEVTVLIVRHAEKQSNGGGLSKKGLQRAQQYVGYFQKFRDGDQALTPTAFFAARDTAVSMRPRLTLDPLARAMKVPLSTAFKTNDSDKLAELIHSGRLAGRTILVCWHHGDIPDLLTALGADPKTLLPHGEWPDGVYGWLIELHLAGDNTLLSSKVINEKLMPNDRNEPPAPVAPASAAPAAPTPAEVQKADGKE